MSQNPKIPDDWNIIEESVEGKVGPLPSIPVPKPQDSNGNNP